MIALIETQIEVDKFLSILKEELEKYRSKHGGTLDLNQGWIYEQMMDRVKTRFRSWQMDRPEFSDSAAESAYEREAISQALRGRIGTEY